MKKLLKAFKITGITLLTIIVLVLSFVGIYSQIGNSPIRAKIEGLGTKLIVYNYKAIEGDERHFKFGYCINDRISINASTNEISKLMIRVLEKRTTCHSKDITLYIEPDNETIIKGRLNDLSIDYEVISGNNMCKQYAELRKELLPNLEEESRLWFEWWLIRESKSEKSKQLSKQFHDYKFNIVASKRTEFAKRNLDYELAPAYFFGNNIPADTIIKYHNLLSQNAKNSPYGKRLSSAVNTLKGNVAPTFVETTLNGKRFNLEQMEGKYVVLDFWGSWCRPCMSGVPKMKEYYNKYVDSVEFVGIACKDKEANWKKAVTENQMNWVQIFNNKSSTNIAMLYGIDCYPTKIIINPEGKIVNKFKGEGEDFYREIDAIMMR